MAAFAISLSRRLASRAWKALWAFCAGGGTPDACFGDMPIAALMVLRLWAALDAASRAARALAVVPSPANARPCTAA